MDTFEELPAILVVIISISLFSVSVANAAMTWNNDSAYYSLQEDCQIFSSMVRASDILCGECFDGTYDWFRIQNISYQDISSEFNSSNLGFEYKIIIHPIENFLPVSFMSSDVTDYVDTVAFETCVNLDIQGRISAANLTVIIWEGDG